MKMFSPIISIIPEDDEVNKYEDGWLLLIQWLLFSMVHWRAMYYWSKFYIATLESQAGSLKISSTVSGFGGFVVVCF